MDEQNHNNDKPTMDTTNPFHWEMHLLAQEFKEREAHRVTDNDNYMADQENLREHNCNVKQLEDRKLARIAILSEEQESEIDRINKIYSQKLQDVETEYTNNRDTLENELYKKSGKSYKKLQKLHTETLSQSQEFEGKAKDIFWRMANSLKKNNSICVSNSVHETSTTTAVATAAVETPPVSPASGSTETVNQARRAIQSQYLEANSSELQPLPDYRPSLEVRDTLPYAMTMSQFGFSAPAPPTTHFAYRPFPEVYSTKRQKTNHLTNTSTRGISTCSRNGAINTQGDLGIHVPIQPSSMATEATFDPHAKPCFSPMKNPGQDLSRRIPASEKYRNAYHGMDNSTAAASELSNESSSTKSTNQGPVPAQASGQYNEFGETQDIPHPNIVPASIERRIFINRDSCAKTSRRDLSKTQATAQYNNVDSKTSVSTPIEKAEYHASNGKSKASPKNDFMPPILLSNEIRPAHSHMSLGDEFVSNDCMSSPSQRYVSLQTARPYKGTPGQFLLGDGRTDIVSNMDEEGSSFDAQTVTPSKRKASGISMDDAYESIPILEAEAPGGVHLEHKESFEVPEQNRRSTNHSRHSNTELAESEIDNSRSRNSEPSRQSATTSAPRNSELARRRVRTPRPTSVASARPVVGGLRLSIAEVRLSANCFLIDFMSYDPGNPSKCYPVTWSGISGSPSYRLQVMKNKKNFLHPFDGTENKASQYPKLIIDDSWVLGGFYHIEDDNHRLEIYRPRSKKEYNEEEQGFNPAGIQSARMRIKFINEIELDRFLDWYRAMHPDAEIRPNTLLGTFKRFFRGGSDSDRTLRGEIENRARRIASLAPMTSA